MSKSKSKKSPPINRFLVYKPIISPKAQPGPTRPNTGGRTPSRQNVGKPADLLKMPIDVFYEIASYLRPLDILQLARASFKLRAVLMSRNSDRVWIAARRTIGMPKCPPDISEPQYASLVFEHTCFAVKYSAQLKVRFCGDCWGENIKTYHELKAAFVPNEWNQDFGLCLLPSADDVHYVVDRTSRCSFYKPEYDGVLKRYVELKKTNHPPTLFAYMKERTGFVQQSFEFGRDVGVWWTKYSAEASAEKEMVQGNKDEDKQKRKNIVHAKLLKAGYTAADLPVWDSEWDKTVTASSKLTDKHWNLSVFPKLKEMIEAEKTRKVEVKRKARLRERTLEFARIYLSRGVPANEPEEGPFMMPSWGIFEDEPRVKALLTEDDCKLPFTEDQYEQIQDLIAEGVVKYNIRARRDLARLHWLLFLDWENEEEADENAIKPFLARATTVFHVNYAAAPKCLSFKTITEIFHLALVYWEPAIGDPPKWRNVLALIQPDILAGKITRELLRVAGAPEDSTWEQMEEICGRKLVCSCRKPGFSQPVPVNILIQHIRHERTWSKLSEAEKWRDEGSEDESGFPIDHAVSEIINFVKILPEGENFNDFMRSRPPQLGGSVGDLTKVRNSSSALVQLPGFVPPLEERGFVCAHCGNSIKKDYLVWHMNAKHKKIALPIDVSSWTFLPRTLDDIGGGNDDEGDLEAGINSL